MVLKHIGLAIACLFLLAQAAVAKPLMVVVISDLNGSYGSTSYAPRINVAIDRIIALQPDLVIATGDLVAGQRKPHLAANQIRDMWAAFHEVVSTPLAEAGIPLAVTPGNHDASGYNGFQLERDIFADEWQSRKPDLHYIDDSDYPFFYAFQLGGVTFISLDATVVGPLRGDQIERLDHLTSSDSRAEIVFGHLPLWAVAQNRESEIIGDRSLANLLQQNDVTMLLSGHHHAYYPG
ncbi:MAG: metallophosphoesterase family protein, partial [Alphaproteobacteria bacterium]